MPIRVLIVDDSSFFRRQITRVLSEDPRLNVVGAAEDGKDAIEKTKSLSPDVVVMDVEMPVMNGIDATRQIMQHHPTSILMFSSLTTDGAKATLDALDAGAVDFLPKKFEDIARDKKDAAKVLCDRVVTIARRSHKPAATHAAVASRSAEAPKARATGGVNKQAKGKLELVAIGTSTGGPVALQNVLTALPANFPTPIILVQHMPGTFTPAFAKRLDGLCKITVKEAVDGDRLENGVAYLAPGGKQMLVQRRGGATTLRIVDAQPGQTYKPCIDMTFNSIAEVYGGKVLAIILTGMGADGSQGCKALKQRGAVVWAQDEATSTVYGMPSAVADLGITDHILPLNKVGPGIVEQV